MTMSQPVRIAALLGLAAALGLGGFFMLLGRKSVPNTAPTPTVHHRIVRHVRPATTPSAATGTHAGPRQKPGPVGKQSSAKPAKPSQPAAELAALRAGLPAPLARALGRHPIVVVELTNPQSEVDGIAFAEAQAGAGVAKAGFVPLSVLRQSDIGKLTEIFGQLLPDPGLLVYKRPATLVTRMDGFIDKETVAQAAINAAHGP